MMQTTPAQFWMIVILMLSGVVMLIWSKFTRK